MTPEALEQLFVGRRDGRVELRMVLVDPAAGRTRSVQLAPTTDVGEAVRWLGRHLAREGRVRDVRRVRVRVADGGGLRDAPDLADARRGAYRAVRDEGRAA